MPPKKRIEILDNFEPDKIDLPHLYGFPWYKWAWEFFNSKDKNAFLCAANQISKSSTLIRKMIHWATAPQLWPKLWKTRPTQFWYFYPTKDLATIEFDEKWVKEFLPRGRAKHHPVYGWNENKEYKKIHSIVFNSGVTIYFRSYAQSKTDIQSATVHFIGCDEELPVHYWPEINARRFSCDGYFNMVFTATLSQMFWFETMECIGAENERFKGAWKRQITMYDCQTYRNRRKSPWTKKRIKEIIESCQSDAEIQRRVYGRFVKEDAILVDSFQQSANYISAHFICPKDWIKILGLFVRNQKAALAVIYCSPNYTKLVCGRIINISTNPVDILVRIKQLPTKFDQKYVNFDARDFIEASRSNEDYFQPVRPPKYGLAGKLNGMFSTKMFEIAKSDQSVSLMTQIQTITEPDLKDFKGYEHYAAMIIGLSQLPIDFKEKIQGISFKTDPYKDMDPRLRAYKGLDNIHTDFDSYDEEFTEFSSYLEP